MSLYGLTENYGFGLIDFSSQTWHTEEYENWRKLDTLLTGVASTIPFALDTGAANAYVATYDPVITAYVAGLVLNFVPTNANTGASTINVNGLGAKAIKIQNVALSAGNLTANGLAKISYNGDHFELIEPRIVNVTIADGSITVAKLSTGHPIWDAAGALSAAGAVTSGGNVIATDFKTDAAKFVFRHDSATYTSAKITYSTADPSGGNDGDLWFKYT